MHIHMQLLSDTNTKCPAQTNNRQYGYLPGAAFDDVASKYVDQSNCFLPRGGSSRSPYRSQYPTGRRLVDSVLTQ